MLVWITVGGLGHLVVQFLSGVFLVPPDIVGRNLPIVAPIPKSLTEMAQRKRVDELMREDVEPWFSCCGYSAANIGGSDMVNKKMGVTEALGGHKPGTYGEVTTIGARQLFYHMGLTAVTRDDDDDGMVFMDMGSGVGKLVIQAYMELPRLDHAIGIELAPIRHQYALSAWQELELSAVEVRNSRKDILVREARLELLEGDIFEADVSEVTHLYIASLCFSDSMMERLAAKLDKEATRLQCVATLRNFPGEFKRKGIRDRINYEVVMKTFGMIERTEFVDMSWGQACEVTVYSKV
jgi:Histone methylation protein DOT1